MEKVTEQALSKVTDALPSIGKTLLYRFIIRNSLFIYLHIISERDCKGDKWENVHDASTVPSFLNDHIWSFRNKCKCDWKARDKCVSTCEWACGVNNPSPHICRSRCCKFPQSRYLLVSDFLTLLLVPNCRDGAGC